MRPKKLYLKLGASPDIAQDIELDVSKITQYGAAFGVSVFQNGNQYGDFEGIQVNVEGRVYSRYSNREQVFLGQIFLADFVNAAGLRKVGDEHWAETNESGPPILGLPSVPKFGMLKQNNSLNP